MLCVAALGGVLWGTLGPLHEDDGRPWLVAAADWRWVPPVVRSDANDLLTNLAVYAPVGVALRLLVRRRGRAGRRDFVLSLGLAIGLSYVTEFLQQWMPGRASSLTDVGLNALGALLGALLAVPAQHLIRRLHAVLFVAIRAHWRFWGVCVTGVGSWIGLKALWGDMFGGGWRAEPRIDWVPFRAHFAARFEHSAADLGSQLAAYGVVALFCLFATRGRARGLALTLLLGIVVGQELLHAFLRPHAAGTTGLVLALTAWLIVVRTWSALAPGAAGRMPQGV